MVTLEKIDLVVERTGVTYAEAKHALEEADGNVVEAIIYIQNQQEESEEKKGMKSADILDTLKEFIRKGNVSRIIISDEDVTLLNIPVTFGAIGVILAPVAAVLGVGTILVANINVSIQDSHGNIIDLNKETSERLERIRSKGAKTKATAEKKVDDIKSKFSKKVDDIEDEFEEILDDIKDHFKAEHSDIEDVIDIEEDDKKDVENKTENQ